MVMNKLEAGVQIYHTLKSCNELLSSRHYATP